jgi:hypothetical protein
MYRDALCPLTLMVSSNDVQRLFLQAILSRKIVTSTLAHLLHAKCVQAVNGWRGLHLDSVD